MNETRGTGVTQRQMLAAPLGAVFVWCNSRISYPRDLARAIGREDLEIQPASWLTCRSVAGRRFSGVVVDHALRPDDAQIEAIEMLRCRGVVHVAAA